MYALYRTGAGTDLGMLVDVLRSGLRCRRRIERTFSQRTKRTAWVSILAQCCHCVATGGHWRSFVAVVWLICILFLPHWQKSLYAIYYGFASAGGCFSVYCMLAEIRNNIGNPSKQEGLTACLWFASLTQNAFGTSHRPAKRYKKQEFLEKKDT